MVVAVCDGCGEYFTGEPHQVIEALCTHCGAGLRPCNPEEVLDYVDHLKRGWLPASSGTAGDGAHRQGLYRRPPGRAGPLL
jgi:hypothetical protein